MKKFMDSDFLLGNATAKALYHTYAENLPIIDYHCHVPPKDIAENKQYSNITELWLGGDHYKWRAMRSFGIDEKYITGDASDYEKFMAYAKIMPSCIGNPLYHWTHLELQRYFDCDLILSEATADEIWKLTSEKLADPSMSARGLITMSKVDLLCTTDDPIDSLEYHKALAEDKSFATKVLPAFRPDKAFNINKPGLAEYYKKLEAVSGVEIKDVASLKDALRSRIEFFDAMGCRTADHGLDEFPMFVKPNEYAANKALECALASDGRDVTPEMLCVLKCEMLEFLAGEYAKHGWVMQLHMGVYRNANTPMWKKLGADTGFDTMGYTNVTAINELLDMMESGAGLPRTILYSIDPNCNAAIGSILGAFQTAGDGFPKVMQGSAWWFNDCIEGMKTQMISLANLSVFGKFLGMLTDSRSFTSYPRHEYFRRILCNLIGEWVEDGFYPYDPEALATLVCDICYNNTKDFFGFNVTDAK
ncbi:MAG: glucuronate isomerase [Ruminococcaceae bacterium]|nr:glucuronate isomerase [Oscillospiraceae bacterium]